MFSGGWMGMADDQGESGGYLGGAVSQLLQFVLGCAKEIGAQQQVFRWITTQRQFGGQQQVGSLCVRLAGGGQDPFSIAGQVADNAIDLGDGDTQSVHERMDDLNCGSG